MIRTNVSYLEDYVQKETHHCIVYKERFFLTHFHTKEVEWHYRNICFKLSEPFSVSFNPHRSWMSVSLSSLVTYCLVGLYEFSLYDRCMTPFLEILVANKKRTIKFENNGSIVRFRLFNVHLWDEHLVYIIFTQFFTDQCYDY